ncbi:MAG: peptidoglycan-binding protein [Cytophagales bacterium]|nr:MAG: peptidoglycan-binding protein [Cytophagales bacterium]
MKRILILLVVISLIVIAIFQYLNYRKFNEDGSYDYVVSEKIDANYHDKAILSDYYSTAYQIGSLAREVWFNHRIDVKAVDKGDVNSVNASLAYSQLRIKAKSLESKLMESKRLKDLGFDNEAIRFIEEKGISEKNYHAYKILGDNVLKKGDKNEAVWELQRLLVAAGFEIPIDCMFSDQTETALKEFQKSKNIFPSGIAGTQVLRLLMQ